MERTEHKTGSDAASARQFALGLSIVFAGLLLMQLFRWLFGRGHWDDPLLFVALLITQLTAVIQPRGFAKLCSQVITLALFVVIIVMWFVRW